MPYKKERYPFSHSFPFFNRQTRRAISKKSYAPIIGNNKGSLSLVSLAVLLMVISYFLTIILDKKRSNQEAKARSEVYLCIKSGLKLEKNYINKMDVFNKGLLSSFLLMKSPIPYVSQAAKITHSTLKVTQQMFHVSHLKQLYELSHCRLENKSQWFINQLYSSTPFLKRGLSGQAIKKVEQCQYIFFPSLKQMRPSKYFTLNVKRVKEKDQLNWKSKEASLNWKPFSG